MIVAHLFAFIALFSFLFFFIIVFMGSPEHKEYLVLLSAITMLSCIIFVYLEKYANKLQNHGAVLQKYQAEVNAQLQEYGVNEIQKEEYENIEADGEDFNS